MIRAGNCPRASLLTGCNDYSARVAFSLGVDGIKLAARTVLGIVAISQRLGDILYKKKIN